MTQGGGFYLNAIGVTVAFWCNSRKLKHFEGMGRQIGAGALWSSANHRRTASVLTDAIYVRAADHSPACNCLFQSHPRDFGRSIFQRLTAAW